MRILLLHSLVLIFQNFRYAEYVTVVFRSSRIPRNVSLRRLDISRLFGQTDFFIDRRGTQHSILDVRRSYTRWQIQVDDFGRGFSSNCVHCKTSHEIKKSGRIQIKTNPLQLLLLWFQKYLRNLGMGHMVVRHEELPVNAQDAVSKLCSNDHLVYIEFRENIVQHDMDCEITEIPKSVFSYYMGLGLPKNSPYTEFVTRELVFSEKGLKP